MYYTLCFQKHEPSAQEKHLPIWLYQAHRGEQVDHEKRQPSYEHDASKIQVGNDLVAEVQEWPIIAWQLTDSRSIDCGRSYPAPIRRGRPSDRRGFRSETVDGHVRSRSFVYPKGLMLLKLSAHCAQRRCVGARKNHSQSPKFLVCRMDRSHVGKRNH